MQTVESSNKFQFKLQNQIKTKSPVIFKNIGEEDFKLAEKFAPCLVFDKNEVFFPRKIGITIYYKPQYPSSILFARIRNNYTFKQRLKLFIRDWLLTFYHTMWNDRKTDPKPIALYKFYRNRPQPVLMEIRNKWKKQKAYKVIEYAIYYDSDIVHVYDLEHIWVYLDRDNQLIGLKGTRHGVIVTQYGSPNEIKYHKGHPIIYVTPGKHSNIINPSQLNQRTLNLACYKKAGTGGIYNVQFFNKEIWKKIKPYDPGKEYIAEVYRRKFAFKPSFKMTKFMIPKRSMMTSWYSLMNEIPDLIINFLRNEILE
ncbi:MAG: hypothetical protein ACTSRZ_14005 [Promethearchaeota archaeon]